MTEVFEFSEFDRKNLIYNFSRMTAVEIEEAQAKLKKAEEETAAKKAAAAAAKPALSPPPPSKDSQTEGS